MQVFQAVLKLIQHSNKNIRDSAYSTTLSLLQAETIFSKLLTERIKALTESVILSQDAEIIVELTGEMNDMDWKYAALKGVETFSRKHRCDVHLSKYVYQFLKSISISECFRKIEEDNKQRGVTKTMHQIKKSYNSVWVEFLKMKKTSELQEEILSALNTDVIPHMTNPKLLIDYLVDSYDRGGVTSLLSLNSLFILITQYNLDYPSFYTKLYKMLTPDLYHCTYTARSMLLLSFLSTLSLSPSFFLSLLVSRMHSPS